MLLKPSLVSCAVLIIFITGCNDEAAAQQNVDQTPTLTHIDISASSSTVYTILQFKAVGRYSDSSESDITSSVTWEVSNNSIASIDANGKVSPVSVGSTDISASLDGVTSPSSELAVPESIMCGHSYESSYASAVNDSDPSNAENGCVKIAQDSSGNWFSGAPSVAAADALGFDALEYTEYESTGGLTGLFVRLNWFSARAWCERLNDVQLGGRSNWQMPTDTELLDLYAEHGSMRAAFGWATGYVYHTRTFVAGAYVDVGLTSGGSSPADTSSRLYPSCIASP